MSRTFNHTPAKFDTGLDKDDYPKEMPLVSPVCCLD